tara:strand:- start:933 stop:1775 length:843 start_codon:yes stop_codon:yes gene_type:complete
MKNKANSTNDVRALISIGFTTKVAKQEAKEILNRAWGKVSTMARNSGVSHWDLPHYAHQVGPKTFKVLANFGDLIEYAQDIRACALELKAAEVVKAAPKVDNTKVRDLGPQAATTLGIDFIDMKGDRRGYCYCCGRIGFMLNDAGRLSRHGYTRPGWGYDTAACHGTRKTPEQTLDIAILWNKSMIQDLEGMLETDLVAFSLKQARKQIKANRVDSYGGRRRESKGSYNRNANARGLRALRAGQEPQSLSGPKVWRRMLTTQLEQHRNELASLEAVKASL